MPRDRRGPCAFIGCKKSRTQRYPGADIPLCYDHVTFVVDTFHEATTLNPPKATRKIARERASDRVSLDQTPAAEPSGWIYYIQVSGMIKIGYAGDLARRFHEYPPTAQLLATRPGTLQDEQDIHRTLGAYRIAGREWYSRDPALVDHILAVVAEHGSPQFDPFEMRRQRDLDAQMRRRRADARRQDAESPSTLRLKHFNHAFR